MLMVFEKRFVNHKSYISRLTTNLLILQPPEDVNTATVVLHNFHVSVVKHQ